MTTCNTSRLANPKPLNYSFMPFWMTGATVAANNLSTGIFRTKLPVMMAYVLSVWLPTISVADVPADEMPLQHQQEVEAEPDTHRHYNRLLRTQLTNLWAFVENAVITRTVWQAVSRPVHSDRPFQSTMPGVQASAAGLTPVSDVAADKLISILTQININLRGDTAGKRFLLTSGAFSDLSTFMNGAHIQGITTDKQQTLNTLIHKIEAKTSTPMSQIVADKTKAFYNDKQQAISILPFTRSSGGQPKSGGVSTGRNEGDSTRPADGHTIARRLEHARTYTNWQDQLLRQTLAGAMAGAGIEAVITVTYKSVYEQRPPWDWNDSDTAEIATAAAGGALSGAVSTAATWALRGSRPGIPLWMTSTIVTGSMHLLKESAKIVTFRDDALTLQQLVESVPATLVMSLGAYFGEQMSPVPLVGAIAGAISGRIAVGVAHNYLQLYLNTPPQVPTFPNATGFARTPAMPSHISVGIVQPKQIVQPAP